MHPVSCVSSSAACNRLHASCRPAPQTVRLGKHVRRFPPLPLAAVQMATMAVLSDAWLAADVASAVASGADAVSVWGGCRFSAAQLVLFL